MDDVPSVPATAPFTALALLVAALAPATTCLVHPVTRSCTGPELTWTVWDPLVHEFDAATGWNVWPLFRDDGPLMPLTALGPALTCVLAALASLVVIAWALTRTRPVEDRVTLSVAGASLAFSGALLALGAYGSLLVILAHL